MEKRKRITEEDLRVTEALIAESYADLKSSVMKAPEKAMKPVADIVRDHPMAAAATAVGAGLIAYQMFRTMSPKHEAHAHGGDKKPKSSLLTQLLSLATPLIPVAIQFAEKEFGHLIFSDRR